jgi:integrase
VAYNQNVDLPVISKALGHTDTQTTMIYIRELNDNRLAEANKKILDSLGII